MCFDEEAPGDGDGSGGEVDGTREASEVTAVAFTYLGTPCEGAAFGVSHDDGVAGKRGKKEKPLIVGRTGVGVAMAEQMVELDDTGERTVAVVAVVDEDGAK